MSQGLRCVCADPRHEGERRPPTLPRAFRIAEPGLCSRYATDQVHGGQCADCAQGHIEPAPILRRRIL